MSVRPEKVQNGGGQPPTPFGTGSPLDVAASIEAAQPADAALGEGNSYSISSPDNPLERNVAVSIRASLNDLCLQKQKGVWAPSSEALKSIFQQRRFTSLDGSADQQGDLNYEGVSGGDHVPMAPPLAVRVHLGG